MANFDSELFGLVFPGLQATQKFMPKIHVQNYRHSSPISLSWTQNLFTAIFCLRGRPTLRMGSTQGMFWAFLNSMLTRLPLPQCFWPRGRKPRPWSQQNTPDSVFTGERRNSDQTMVWVSGEEKLRPWSEFRAFVWKGQGKRPPPPRQDSASGL